MKGGPSGLINPPQLLQEKVVHVEEEAKKESSTKAAPKKATVKKAAPKKTAVKKAAPKKTAVKKTAVKKTAAKGKENTDVELTTTRRSTRATR